MNHSEYLIIQLSDNVHQQIFVKVIVNVQQKHHINEGQIGLPTHPNSQFPTLLIDLPLSHEGVLAYTLIVVDLVLAVHQRHGVMAFFVNGNF